MFTITPPPHLVWEVVGSEVVVLDTTSHTTHRLTGDLAEAFLAAAEGRPINTQEVMALQERGFLEPRSPLTRRSLITAGGVGIGLGITSLALPTVAAASSTQPKPSITAASLAPGDWEWFVGGSLSVAPSAPTVALPDLPVFIVGEAWRLTLTNLGGVEAVANIQQITSGSLTLLTLSFTFPLTGGLTAPAGGTVLQGILTKNTDNTVFSEPFPITEA